MHTALALSHESEWPAVVEPALVTPATARRYRDHVLESHQYNPSELLRCCLRRTAPDYQRLWRGELATCDLPRGYSQKFHAGPRPSTRDSAPSSTAPVGPQRANLL
eukprot:scaffold80101_cov63-Phaeocystis_antarctica.AAC.2